jgi:exonuclease VII small subunit
VAGSPVDRLVSHIPPGEWPEIKQITGETVLLDDTFKVALKEAMECASEDSSRYVLNGACLDTREKGAHYVIGSDGRHLYSANTFQFNLPESLIVPTCKFLSWAGFEEDGPWKLRMLPAMKTKPEERKKDSPPDEPPWFRIDSDHWSYVAKAIDGQFPNWKQVVPEGIDRWTKIILHPPAVDTLLEALPLLPGGDENCSSITLVAGNGLMLRAKGRDQTAWTSINVPEATVTGKAVEIALNRTFLLQALRFGFHQIAIQSSLEPLVFTSPGKTMVVMSLRLEGPAKAGPAQNEVPHSTETAAAAPPSAAAATNQTEERKTMSATIPTMTAPERGNLRANNGINGEGQSEDNRSAFKAALEQLDKIKVNLRDVIGDLNDAATLLKTAEKDQRAAAKEVQTVRAKLKEIQSVAI